jgi:transglutaminase-like putative cysteine protease
MSLALQHRRLTILMAGASLLAFSGGAGFEPVAALLAFLGLLLAYHWQPSQSGSRTLERVLTPVAMFFVARALYHVFFLQSDVVVPVVDLLLLLMCAESLRSLDSRNEGRLYALSFALILASTAYRPGVLFAMGFLAFLVLGTMSLMVGHLRRQAEVHGGTLPGLRRQLLLGSSAVTVATLAMSAVVFLAFPRNSRGWTGSVPAMETSVAGFSDEISLGGHGSTISVNPQVVLRVEFTEGAPLDPGGLYWRGRSYDHFDGVRWSRTPRPPPANAPLVWYRSRWPGPVSEYRVYARHLDARVLFSLHPLLEVDAESAVYPVVDNVGDFRYMGNDQPTYRARSVVGRPPATMLREAEEGWTPGRGTYLQVPGDLSPRIPALAASLTEGLETTYDKAAALERWFHSEFTYTRELPARADQTGLDHFLFQRRAGHCEYYSTAMVVMLRTLGVEAREVNGFLGGRWNEFGKFLAVTQNEAHSWVEVWFPGLGWVPFDPTPPGSFEAGAEETWLWPGRFFLDGIQHRWSKWILDYTIEDQVEILGRLGGAVQPDGSVQVMDPQRTGLLARLLREPLLWGLVGILLLLLTLRWRQSGTAGARQSPETRLYLRLRKLFRKSGSGASMDPLPPLSWARELEGRAEPGWEPATDLVNRYLALRFGGQPATDGDLGAMQSALRAARAARRRR